MFKPVDPKANFPQMEENVLGFWKKNKIFEKSVSSRPATKTWTFLDGPPFVTGMPHYGTLLSSIPKDLFGRFWTMKGYRVRRVWGWDGHGLPIENKVENKLHIKRKKDIEEVIGVGKFIAECLGYVQEVSAEWEWYVDHIGRWVDFKNAYKTWDLPYMETVMWVFRQIYDKGFIYKGLRVSLYCPHCATPISNFEVAMDDDNYQEITEPADTYKYQLADDPDTYLLAWSTTPWNKIVTPALAVNPKLTYVKVSQGGQNYILAKSTLKMLTSEPYKIVDEFPGQKLVGQTFIPHYDFYKVDSGKKAFIVIAGDFVTAEEGTGIVTIAAYGEEDLAAMKANNIQIVLHLDEEGKLKPEVPNGWAGMDYLDVNPKVNEDLKNRGLLYSEAPLTHTVPTCWRCHTRLIYAPQNAWFIDIQKLKDQMVKTNEEVNWFPAHFKHGRFLKSLQAAPDWCISRSRYWGSPVPVWECSCGEHFVPESIAQLGKVAKTKITNLHKPGIDELSISCPKCGQPMKRTPEVLDSWVEAGSASFAERHYPFVKAKLDDFFPPDFIVEYTGQIRAWFYVLHVITNALLGSYAFKNVAVTGVILGTDGRKMSKNFGNFPDPKEMLTKYGGDALRLYLLGAPVMRGEDIRISEEEYRNQVRTFLLTLWNVYSFFVLYANSARFVPTKKVAPKHVLDLWIRALLANLTGQVTACLEQYDTVGAVTALKNFVDDLSLWYIRRSRDRKERAFFATCHEVLVTLSKLLAPFTPFVAEEMYKNLTGKESVHLEEWPFAGAQGKPSNNELIEQMATVRKICELGHAQRKEAKVKVRQPLSLAVVSSAKLSEELTTLIKDELNVKAVEFKLGKELTVKLDLKLTPALEAEGQARELVRQIQDARKEAGCALDQKITVTLPDWPEKYTDYIAKQVLATKIIKGDKFKIA